MATNLYNDVLQRVQRLSPEDQLRLLEHVASLVRSQVTSPSQRRSILELKGLGKEIWQDVDAQDYIDRERASWSG